MQLHPKDAAMIGKETDCDDCGEDFILQRRNMAFDDTERCVLVFCDDCQDKPAATEMALQATPCQHGTLQLDECKECNILAQDLSPWEIDAMMYQCFRDEHYFIP